MRDSEKRALSPVVATVILIAVTVLVSIAIAAWMGALTVGITSAMEVNITPNIYSDTHNIGVLNENAVFVINIKNKSSELKNITILITTQEGNLFNEEISVKEKSENTTIINQKLLCVGSWIVKVLSMDSAIIESYSFVTVTNGIDADIQINALNNIQDAKNSAVTSNIIALLSLFISSTISIIALVFSIRSSRHKKGELAKAKKIET